MTKSNSSPSLRWRLLRWAFIGMAILITLLALTWGEENVRGRKRWEAYQRQLLTAGEKLDLASFVPPPVPDDQNFTMTPFLAPMFDFRPDRQPGESAWRDTNALNRANSFARVLGSPKSNGEGRDNRRMVDLISRSAAMAEAAKREGAPPLDRAAAARQILADLQPSQPVIDEIRAAVQRPYARFNIRYGDGPATLLPHLAVMKGIANVLHLRALAELELGQSDAALADLAVVRKTADAIQNEPFLISGLVRVAIIQLELQPIWEGLAQHRWSDAQLATLQTNLGRIDLLADYAHGMRGERAGCNEMLTKMRTHKGNEIDPATGFDNPAYYALPVGWLYQNQLVINRMHQDVILAGVDPVAQRVDPTLYTDDSALTRELNSGFMPYKILARMLLPAISKSALKYAYGQTGVNEAILACALERYRLAHGEFPEKLDALTPTLLARLPHDLIEGEPLKYRRLAPDHFLVYSIGWNEKDDGGVPGDIKKSTGNTQHPDTTTGDWVWDSAVGDK